MLNGENDMSSILDIILIAVVAVFAIIGAKKGFVRSISGFVIYLASFFVTLAFYSRAAGLVKKIPFIANMITETEMPEFSAGKLGFMEKIKTVINYIISSDDVSATTDAVIKNLAADIIATILAFILVFIAAILILKLVFLMISSFTELPVLKQADSIFGLVFGICCGFFWAWIAASVFGNLLFPILNSRFPDVFITPMLDSTIFKLCTKVNPMTYIFMAIQKLSGR